MQNIAPDNIDIHSSGSRRKASPVGFRVWLNIARLWTLKDTQAARLLGIPISSYRRYKADTERANLDIGQMERLSLLLGIYKSLQILLPQPDMADQWLKQPNSNPLFGGQTPLDRMLKGMTEDVAVVRRHLDAERGGWA